MKRLVWVFLVCLLCGPNQVPLAHGTTIDLTTQGSWATINGAVVQQYSPTGTGSGNIDTFLRIQSFGVQKGYNTDHRPLEYDEDNSGIMTHSLLLSAVPLVTNGGTAYREFLLDINQNGEHILSLDELRIALHGSPDLFGYSTIFGSPVYDLDDGQDNWIKLDYSLNGGSGQGDMLAYIPDSLFMDGFGVYLGDWVYLYSKFGVNSPADDGFEEWAYGVDGSIIPEPATALLLAIGALALAAKRKARERII